MLRHSRIVAMEIFSSLRNGAFELEPYEVAWVSEAIAYVYLDEVSEGARLDLRAQISIDGQRWLDFGPKFDTLNASGSYFLQLRHFGTWLRLVGEVAGGPEDSHAMVANFYWDLKE